MKKEKGDFFETEEITDANEALLTQDKETKRLKVKLICTAIALLGSIGGYIVMWASNGKDGFWYTLCGCVWLLGIIAMFVAGSFFSVIKTIFKVGQFAYRIVPFYILDLLAFVIGLALGVMLTFSFPVIPCLMMLYNSYKSLQNAEEFLDIEDPGDEI